MPTQPARRLLHIVDEFQDFRKAKLDSASSTVSLLKLGVRIHVMRLHVTSHYFTVSR
jgi:hypothetical protein